MMDRTPYGGNAGRLKAKKSKEGSASARRVSTPYEKRASGKSASKRPAALAKPSSSWTDSASRILTRGAAYLFTSLFKRRAPAITASDHVEPPASPMSEEAPPPLEPVPQSLNEVEVEQGATNAGTASDCIVVKDTTRYDRTIESVLRNKKLSRDECERYISLVRAKLAEAEAEGAKPGTVVHRKAPEEQSLANGHVFSRMDAAPPVGAPWEVTNASVREEYNRAPWERNEVPSVPQVHRNGSRWTPLQAPITGGPELLRQRAPMPRSGSVRTSALRTQGDLDLSCFRKDRKVQFAPRLVTSIPQQSSQTAHKILKSLDKRKSPLQDARTRRQQSVDVLVG